MEIKDKYIPMYYRNIPLKIKPSKFTIIDKIEKINKINNETNNDIDIDKKINNLKEKFKDFNIIYIIKLVLNSVNTKFYIEYIKNMIVEYKNNKNNKNNKDIISAIKNNIFLFIENTYLLNPSIIEINSNINKYIGFYTNNKYYYLSNDKWHKLDKHNIEELKRIILKSNYKKTLSDISGFIENNKFKIIDKRKFTDALTLNYKESKRTIITGRTCNTFKREELINIIKNLNHNPSKYKSKKDLCMLIELILLYNNNTFKDNKKWFI